MDIINAANSVGPIRPSSPVPFETDKIQKDETFGEMLKHAVGQANDLQIDSDKKMYKLATGEVQDIHEVMVAMEKANISLQLTLEIRDRLMEAWQTMMRIAL
jgi:flagellar hook-basal body complex protein FliE